MTKVKTWWNKEKYLLKDALAVTILLLLFAVTGTVLMGVFFYILQLFNIAV